jgi:hypothetical protein
MITGRCRTLSRVTGHPTGHGQDTTEADDVLAAAERLGITPDAIRKRIARGQLAGIKRGGRWYALLPAEPDTDTTAGQFRQDGDRTADAAQTGPGQDNESDRTQELIDQLRGEIGFLREANRRQEAIIAAMVQQQRALPAPESDNRQDTDRTTKGQLDRPARLPWWRLWGWA